MRDESAIILTSPSESQRVHCPGKIGWQGEGARALVWPRYLLSDTAQQTWGKGNSLKVNYSTFIKGDRKFNFDGKYSHFTNKSNDYSRFNLDSPLRRHYYLSQCCLRADNNLQIQNILTPQLSLSAFAICLSWKQFIVNNYSRIVILKLALA